MAGWLLSGGRSWKPAAGVALLAAALGACSGAEPFRRPSGGAPTIRDEAGGRVFTDCRAAFAQTTADTVLTFSEGVFACGPEVQAASDWLVVRGAGAGRTFLEVGGKGPLRLTAIRPGRTFRIEDATFGGLLPLPSPDATAVLARVGVATDRPALFGDAGGPVGSVMVVHSVLAATATALPPADGRPRPLALNGNERVAVVESVLQDVEQEFERYPAPGSVVLLSAGVEAAFSRHEPAAAARREPSTRPNVQCSHPKNPLVACRGAPPAGEGPVLDAARRLLARRPLEELEPALGAAARGFGERFRMQIGAGIRQPDVFWFDDERAGRHEAEQAAREADPKGREPLLVLVRAQAAALAAVCADPARPMRPAIERARALDRLLPTPEAAAECEARIKARTTALVASCASTWTWGKVLESLADSDAALGAGRASTDECKAKLRERILAVKAQSPFVRAYLREVNRVLALGAALEPATEQASLDPVIAALPFIEVRTGRNVPLRDPPGVVDRLVKAALQPGAGDGRRLVEATKPCQLGPAAPNAPANRAFGKIELAEKLPNAADAEEPRVVVSAPVESTLATLGFAVEAGAQNVALLKKCDDAAVEGYGAAVLRYVREELARHAVAGSWAVRGEAELALLIASQADGGKNDPRGWRPRALPIVPAALTAVNAELGAQRSAAQVAVAPALPAAPLPAEPAPPKGPVEWSLSELPRDMEILASAGVADLETCAFLLPHLGWNPAEKSIESGVILGKWSARLRCRADAKGFELSLRADDDAARAALLEALSAELTSTMGVPALRRTAHGVGNVWTTRGGRSAFALQKPGADPLVGLVLVPPGSTR